jgi:hypothetical protein
MDSLLNVGRRNLVKWGLATAGMPMLAKAIAANAFAQDASAEGGKKGAIGGRAEEELYTGKGLQGGGQLEIRLTQSIYTSDPDALSNSCTCPPASTFISLLGMGFPAKRSANHSAMNVPVFGPLVVAGEPLKLCRAPS